MNGKEYLIVLTNKEFPVILTIDTLDSFKNYIPTKEDLAFAQRFIEWNNLKWGIQRVDSCRSENGELLLVELEDLNSYLSLLQLNAGTCNKFIEVLQKSLKKAIEA